MRDPAPRRHIGTRFRLGRFIDRHHPRLHLPRLISVLIATLLAVLGGWPTAFHPAVAATPAEFVGDDERDVFVGTGSLLLPGSMGSPGRGAAANCPGCRWRATLACDLSSADACRGQARLCTGEDRWLRIWLARPGGPWEDLGSACFGPGGPASRDRAEMLLVQQVIVGVPPLGLTHQPPGGVLPHLPVRFDSGQIAGPRQSSHAILGLGFVLTVEPRWTWAFGDGTGDTGAGASGPRVDHAYAGPGRHTVRVRTTWTGRYVVDGLGPLSIQQPVIQEAERLLPVGEAHALLIR